MPYCVYDPFVLSNIMIVLRVPCWCFYPFIVIEPSFLTFCMSCRHLHCLRNLNEWDGILCGLCCKLGSNFIAPFGAS